MTTTNTVTINEIPVNATDPTKTAWGPDLSAQYFFVLANGTAAAEEFDPASISAATQSRMALYGRGISVSTGGGGDTVTGSAYGDVFSTGAGVNRIDGGANTGTTPHGDKARDVLNVFAASAAALEALSVVELAAGATGADGDAYAAGYRIKVTNGLETDYLKNVEQINVFRADLGNAYAKTIMLAVEVREIAAGPGLADTMHFAWVQGTDRADSFDAQADVSGATQALMTTHGRGVYVDMGAGNDTVTGSGYGDDITLGSGTNYADGGLNAGTTPWGGKPQDVLHVTVASAAAAAAVQVVQLGAGLTGLDADAFTRGYTHKVVAGSEIDYIKGIERVTVQIDTGNGGSTFARDIALEVAVHEADLTDPNIGDYMHLAWVNGTAGNDSIDASATGGLLSAGVKARMLEGEQGVWIDGGSGNDTITGSAYGDNIRNGSGNAKIDGGANAGGMDVFEISVDSNAAMAAVQVAASDDPAYAFMVTYGNGQKDYLKNVEAITVNVTGTGAGKWIPLAVQVHEITADGDPAGAMHHAWAQGTDRDDSFDAASVSTDTRALMADHGRGIYADMGAGNDTVTGSGFGDDITLGSGTNYADGGLNAGTTPWGGKAQDVLHVTVASAAAAAAVQVVQLGAGLTGLDADAFTRGYTHKVVAGSEIDYIKGIERVTVQIDTGSGSTFARDIALEVAVHEADLTDPNIGHYMHLAWVNGTAGNDTIDASSLLSAGVKARMLEGEQGVWIDGGSGNDTITGSAYGDNIRNGSGNAKIDGGANAGGMDVFEISVGSNAAMAAVQVVASDDPAYAFMVTYGNGQKDYLKNVEAVTVYVTGTGAGKWIPLAVQVHEIDAGGELDGSMHFAWAQGTERAESFNAQTDVSAATRDLMDEHGRGIYADMGAGDDTVVGSGYGDNIVLGSGTNYADGGLNAGTTPWGAKGADALQVMVASQAAADAVQVLALGAGLTGLDADAFGRGYTHKVVAGSEIDYIKGIERVTILLAGPSGSSFVREVALAVTVQEAAVSDPNIGHYSHLAWISGTSGADAIDASATGGLLSTAITQEMATRGKGVQIDGGAGNDTITGSAQADLIRNGAGNAKVDGGANGSGKDIFEIVVASTAALNAVQVAVSDDPAYAFMVTHGSGQKDYLKNIEAVSVRVEGGAAGKWIPLALEVTEFTSPNPATLAHVAGVRGTVDNDSFDAATGLSGASKALSALHGRGIHADLGAGNDTIVATAYGDNLIGGAGTNYIDGGANLGTNSQGSAAQDVVEMYVATQLEADAVSVAVLSAASTGADLAAFNAGYRFKVANGTQEINYLKNVERVSVSVWNDKDGDGVRDFGGAADPANEITLARSIALVANSAPSFAGVPAGVSVDGIGADYSQIAASVGANGKLLSVGYLELADGSSSVVLARHNADGSIDTGFGAGSGRVALATSGQVSNTAPVQLADGKIMLAVSTPGANFDFRVMRLNADGSVDATYGSAGSTVVNVGPGSDLPTEILVQADGKVIVAGFVTGSNTSFSSYLVATRLNTDGSLDTGFGVGGKLQFSPAGVNATMSHATLQADGKLLVSGFIVGAAGNPDAAVVRFNANGSLDTSFGNAGTFLLAIGSATDNARAVAVLADGKILLAGSIRSAANDVDGFLLRLNSNGTLDTSFGSAGIVKAHLTDGHDLFSHAVVQPDGKIVTFGTVAGTVASQGIGADLMVMRYLANGQPDTGFGQGGMVRVPGHGIGVGMDPAGLSLVGDKIVVFGSTITDLASVSVQPVIARINADGTLDASFAPAPASTMGGSVLVDGIRNTALDRNAAIHDAELHARGNYGGASLTLARQGGASADDLFAALGEVSFAAGQLSVGGVIIGTVTQAGGTLTLSFNTLATQGLVNRAMHGIGYSNDSATPSSSVKIDWTFNDGNSGAQGLGGALGASATTEVLIGTTVDPVTRSLSDPAMSATGAPLSGYPFLAYVSGSARGESFDSNTHLSEQVRALMAELGRGARFELGAGDDTLVGTGGSDEIYAGSGTNRIDGGAQAGAYPFGGGAGRDTLHVLVADQAAANAVTVTMLDASATGADGAAFAAGYEVKVVNGSETDYVKNVEMIKIFRWLDANGSKTVEGNELVWMREIPVALRVYETAVSSTDPTRATDGRLLSDIWHLASAEGWERDDSFNAATDVSSAARLLMAQQGRGVWVDGGAGDDTLVGSAYGDNFIGGAGTNRIDGGAHGGSTPHGQRPSDVLEIYVDSQARANAVQAIVLDAAATGEDAAAFASGYTWKVVDGAAVNYVKNVEDVNVFIWNDANGDRDRDGGESTHARHIRLALKVDEVARHATDPAKDASGNPLASYGHLAWANGSAAGDSFNAATDISSPTQALMAQLGRGVFVDTGAGNDTVTGSAYGDNFITGSGVNRIDGGAHGGTNAGGGNALDVFELYVADQAAADEVTVTALTAGMGGADGAAWDQGYRVKVGNGAVSTDYLKNIEQLNVFIWNDKDGDGQRDWGNSDTDPAREITFVRGTGLAVNTAPSFSGAPAGAIVRDGGADYGIVGGGVLANGKLLSLVYIADANNVQQLALERSLADGSIDTTYGGGTGRVVLGAAVGSPIVPLLLANGKVVVTQRTGAAGAAKLTLVNEDGSIDASFGTGGSATLAIGSTPLVPFQVIESGGKLWVIGYSGSPFAMTVARLHADGTLDTSFSGDGYVVLPSHGADLARAAVLQPDGKLVVVGYAQGAASRDVLALRLNTDGSLDTGFGTGGKVFLQASPGVEALDNATSMAVLPSGKILIGGYVNSSTNNATTNDGMLLRLNADGSLDTSFGTGGRVRVPGTPDNDYVFKVVALDDGSFLTLSIMGGTTASNGDVTISRLRADGSLDPAFGSGGVVRYTGYGMGSDVGTLVVSGGKILMFGAVNHDSAGNASSLLLRLNSDGSLDTSFASGFSSVGGVTRVDGYHWTAIDTNAAIHDAELSARGNYGGATLAIERTGGANADDLYAGVGEVSFAGGQLSVAGLVVGTVAQAGGRLDITFNNSASEALVARALHGIGYANANPAAASIALGWQFSDGNGNGSQGVGPALGASGSTTIEIGLVLRQSVASLSDPSRTVRGETIAQLGHMASVDGSGAAETVDGSTAFLPQTAALMASTGRGARFDMGAGDDRVTGTAYADEFVMGAGLNRVDGGAGADVLKVFVADQAAADAVVVSALDAGMAGADGEAYAQGYRFKLATGAGETDYLRNVEQVQVATWQDKDGDRVRDDLAGAADEVNVVRTISLTGNTAPSFSGAPAGVVVRDQPGDGGILAGRVLHDGKLLSVGYVADANEVYSLVVARSMADGSPDTGFGDDGRIVLATQFGSAIAPLELADGSLLVTNQVPGGTVRVTRLAADGSVDASYGSGGSVVLSSGANMVIYRQLLDATGKLTIVGHTSDAGSTSIDMLVTRLNADGSLDTSFNGSGKLRLPIANASETIRGAALQADGKLVVVGYGQGGFNQDVVAMRINADGTLDTSFGTAGKTVVKVGTGVDGVDVATSMQLLPSGKILLAGYTNAPASGTGALGSYDGMLMRLNADGTLDASFGSGGTVRAPATSGQEIIYEVAVQEDGSIVTLGTSGPATSSLGADLVLARFRADGTLDTGFGSGGEVRLNVRGMGADGAELAIVDGKIVVFGTVYNATDGHSSPMLLRLNANGSLDTSFVQPGATSLGNTVRADGVHFTAVDANASIFDAEAAARGNYDGATLRVQRQGGAQATDLFGGVGDVAFSGGRVTVGGVDVGSATNGGGSLTLVFNASATQALVNRAMHGIGYASGAASPSASVTLDWVFSDAGLATGLAATGSSVVEIGLLKVETAPLLSDPTRTTFGAPMSSVQWMATVNGSARTETFDAATGIGATAQGLMTTWGRGAFFDMGGGGDTVTGTGFSDEFIMGAGVNRIDGGANAGTHPHGGAARDRLTVFVASDEQAKAVRVTVLDASATGEDAAAFAAGYELKVVNGAETDYVRNIEMITIEKWTDADGDRVRDGAERIYVREIPVQLKVNEIGVGTVPGTGADGRPLSESWHFAWAEGGPRGDVFNAATDVPAATRALMDTHGRGLFVSTRGGNDTITGSPYSDSINAGAGINYVDGGANGGSTPPGHKPLDSLDVFVRSELDANAISVTALNAGMGTADAAAFAAGYVWKVVAGQETDYVRNIEVINVSLWNDLDGSGDAGHGEGSFLRAIQLALNVNEMQLHPTDPTRDSGGNLLSGNMHYAWANGTSLGEQFNAALDVSAATLALMAKYGRGIWTDMGGGDDRAVGSAYGDSFTMGAGVNYVDGGANLGTNTSGEAARDMLDVYVADQAAADAVAVTALTAGMSGVDAAAYADGYRWKVVNGSVETDYLKNVEQVHVHIWQDKDGDGQRDYLPIDNPANEMTYARGVTLTQNSAPSFTGAPAGVSVLDAGTDFTATRFVVTPDGKTVTLASLGPIEERTNYIATLVRHNADGSLDTSFGGGTGMVKLPTFHFSPNALALQADGKLLVAYTTAFGAGADFKVVRYLANGNVDTSFGVNGEAVVDFNGQGDQVRAMLVTADGSIVVAGTVVGAGGGTDSHFGVARLTPTGQLDTGFNGTGKLAVALAPGADIANAIALQADGKLVVAGNTSDTTGTAGLASRDMAVVRIGTDGTLDTSFGSGGKVRIAASAAADNLTAVKVTADGRIILAGSASANGTDDHTLVRLLANGSLDTAFGNGGKMLSGVAGSDRAYAMVLQADGKIVVTGETGADNKLLVARYLPDGSPDLGFGVGGTASVTLHGIRDYAVALAMVGDKILVLSPAYNTTEAHVSMLLARLNADGSLDTGFGPGQASSLGGTVQADGLHPVVLDANVAIHDADLVARGNYAGASLVLARQGGADGSDLFSATGNVSFDGGLKVGGVNIGWVEQNGGRLTLNFNQLATQGLVNQALHGIAYSNTSSTPPASVTIGWTFSDGGNQGIGGIATATGSTLVQIGVVAHEVVRSFLDPAQAADGRALGSIDFLANLHGTLGADSATSANLSAGALQLMNELGRGARFTMGAGDDTVVGTAWSDEFVMGSGVNKVQGGAQGGTSPYGGTGRDALLVYVRNQAGADAVTADMLTPQATGADLAAFNLGFEAKIVNGDEVDYIRDIELVAMHLWTDTNGDGIVNGSEGQFLRDIRFRADVSGVQVSPTDATKDIHGNLLANQWHFAWANGTAGDDFVVVDQRIGSDVLALMQTHKRGAWIDLGDGNDVVLTGAFGDNINVGKGLNWVDGGANDGPAPNGNAAIDVIEVTVASLAERNAVSYQVLKADATGADGIAYAAGYRFKIVAPGETDYTVNVETLSVSVWKDLDGDGQRDYDTEVTDTVWIDLNPDAPGIVVVGTPT